MWRSIRDWNAQDKERLEDYLEKARHATHLRRLLPGVPAVVFIGNGGDKRRKRKAAWAVMAGGKPEDPEKICVVCAGREVLEVSLGNVQPVQVRASHFWWLATRDRLVLSCAPRRAGSPVKSGCRFCCLDAYVRC